MVLSSMFLACRQLEKELAGRLKISMVRPKFEPIRKPLQLRKP